MLPPVNCSLSHAWAEDSEAVLDFLDDGGQGQHSMATVTCPQDKAHCSHVVSSL